MGTGTSHGIIGYVTPFKLYICTHAHTHVYIYIYIFCRIGIWVDAHKKKEKHSIKSLSKDAYVNNIYIYTHK